jgi:hypothetical protein
VSGRRVAAATGLVGAAVAGSLGGWVLGRVGAETSTPGSQPRQVSAAPAATATGTPSAPSQSPSTRLADVRQLGATAATTEVLQAGLRTKGAPVEAWSWSDANGRNVLLTTKTVDRREGSVVRAATLHVYHAAGLGRSPRMLLTPLRDPGTVPCDLEFNLDFVPGSIQVTDADGDGYGEASVGWWSSCRGDPGPERIKLALVTKGTYSILRGSGLVAAQPSVPAGITVPPARFAPNVPEGRWPARSYPATVALFKRLFR